MTCGGCHAFPPAGHPAARRLARRDREDAFHPREARAAGRPAAARLPQHSAAARHGAGARGTTRAARPSGCRRRSPGPIRQRSPVAVRHDERLTMADMPGPPAVSHLRARRHRRRRAARRARHRHAPGRCLRGPLVAGRERVVRRSRASRIPRTSRSTDVDGDGVQDLLVGDLGEFFPADHNKGAVIWLRGLGAASSAPSGWTAGRASPTSRRRTSTATAEPISPSPRSAGGRRGQRRHPREPDRRRRRSRSFTTHIDRSAHRAPSTSFRSISTATARWTSSRCSRRSTRPSSPTSTRARAIHVRARKSSTPRRIRTGARRASRSSTSTRTAISTSC